MRTTLRAAALVASAAMAVVAVQGAPASADSTAADREAGATALPLSASARATAIKDAQAGAVAAARQIGLGAQEKLVVRDVVKDADGTVHTRYERTYDGLPVLGGDLVTHARKDGSVKGISRAHSEQISLPTTSASVAAAPGARKVVWAADGKPVLAYETVVTGTQADGTPRELHVITDATSGKKLYSYEGIHTGTGTSQYSGTVPLGTTLSGSSYSLTDGGRGGHKTYDLNGGTSGTGTLFTDADDVWGSGTTANRQTAGVDAAYGAGVTWDFYKTEFGRNGIAGDGKAAYSRVHYGNAYINAFWSDSCFCMTYGDGANNLKPLTSLDVAAHEMSHGLTASTAGLKYSRESGGLNEATSDILGTSVEFYANNSADAGDYLIGEKIDIRGNGTPLRYMDRPSRDGSSADYWSRNVGRLDVHYSSGPANHFFYLLSEGSGAKTVNGVSYDSPTADGSTVTGIGRDKAYKIWYKALSTYMTSSTDYAGARAATLQAAGDLYGAGSAEQQGVTAAWNAINVK